MRLRRLDLVALGVLAVTVTLVIMTGCKSDIVLPPPRGVAGEYHGLMIITENFGAGGVPPVTDTDNVIFILRSVDSSYQYRFEPTLDPNDDNDFCDIDLGEWSILNQKIVMTPLKQSVGQTCNPNLIPEGTGFGFFPTSIEIGDTLRIRQERPADFLLTEFELVLDKEL